MAKYQGKGDEYPCHKPWALILTLPLSTVHNSYLSVLPWQMLPTVWTMQDWCNKSLMRASHLLGTPHSTVMQVYESKCYIHKLVRDWIVDRFSLNGWTRWFLTHKSHLVSWSPQCILKYCNYCNIWKYIAVAICEWCRLTSQTDPTPVWVAWLQLTPNPTCSSVYLLSWPQMTFDLGMSHLISWT